MNRKEEIKKIRSSILKCKNYDEILSVIKESAFRRYYVSYKRALQRKMREERLAYSQSPKTPKIAIEYQYEMSSLGGKLGGAMRRYRQNIVLYLTYYILNGSEYSAWKIRKIQQKIFGISVSDEILAEHFSDTKRTPGTRIEVNIDKTRIDDAKAIFALLRR